MSANTILAPAVLFSRKKNSLRAANGNATSDAQVTNIKIDRGVSSWSVLVYKTHYAETLTARPFGANFSDGMNTCMVDRQNVRRDIDIGAWKRR